MRPPIRALKPEQLDALVSPIALYPDTFGAVLMASTYPLEVVQAARWADENKNLKGEQLKAEADKQSWDDSVKSLTATPRVLDMMSSKLDWTQKLGDAVLAQQADVMDAIQRLRAKADANNKLESTPQQKVSKRSEGSKQVIVIEPTDPKRSMCRIMIRRSSMGRGLIQHIRRTTARDRVIVAGAAIATGLAFGAGLPSGAGPPVGITGAAA